MHLVVNLASYNTRPNTEYYIYLYPLTRAFIFVLSTPATMSRKMPNFLKKPLWHLRLYFGVNCGTLQLEQCQIFYACRNYWSDIHERYLISFFYLFIRSQEKRIDYKKIEASAGCWHTVSDWIFCCWVQAFYLEGHCIICFNIYYPFIDW